LAGPTRLELATSGVTGRRSNQLNYDPVKIKSKVTGQRENNNSFRLRPRNPDYNRLEAKRKKPGVSGFLLYLFAFAVYVVGGTGFEPVTPGL
jgi:hypothetical protein